MLILVGAKERCPLTGAVSRTSSGAVEDYIPFETHDLYDTLAEMKSDCLIVGIDKNQEKYEEIHELSQFESLWEAKKQDQDSKYK